MPINDVEMIGISRAGNPTQEEHDAFRSWLRIEYGTGALPSAVDNALYSKAWELGHANGYGEVAATYGDLADLVILAYRTK
jgi:hypothetical protein